MGNPPEVPQRMNWTSPSAPLVADPVAGPCLCTFTITRGISPMIARPMFSEYRLIPGPEEAVIARRPAATAPRHIPMDEISSSPWMTTPPRPGSSFIMPCRMEVAGVMGVAGKEITAGINGRHDDGIITLPETSDPSSVDKYFY